MNLLPENEIIVETLNGRCVLLCTKPSAKAQLLDLGLRPGGRDLEMVRQIVDDVDRVALITQLINLNALFVNGGPLPPSNVVAFYCQQGCITDTFRAISWSGPGQYNIETVICPPIQDVR